MSVGSARYPFPAYPNGWFRVSYSSELGRGDVVPLQILGRDLVLFRDEAGTARVFDAYCPHLGAHLGHGGRVEGESLRCPFHAWRFGADGDCVEIPYAKRIPPKASVRVWPVCEQNGLVMLWHHAEGEAPLYEPPDLPMIGDPEWSDPMILRWKIRARWLDMNENAVDQVHFKYVHGTHTIPQSEAEIEDHMLRVRSRMKMGTPRGEITGGIDTTDYGPGLQVVHLTGIIETIMINTSTPIDTEFTDTSFAYTVHKIDGADATHGVGQAIIRDLEKQMTEDIPIWENKRYYTRPRLCEGDGPLPLYRKWMEQFFTESSAALDEPAPPGEHR